MIGVLFLYMSIQSQYQHISFRCVHTCNLALIRTLKKPLCGWKIDQKHWYFRFFFFYHCGIFIIFSYSMSGVVIIFILKSRICCDSIFLKIKLFPKEPCVLLKKETTRMFTSGCIYGSFWSQPWNTVCHYNLKIHPSISFHGRFGGLQVGFVA